MGEKKADTQDIADILLDAEVKLGELLEAVPQKRNKEGSTQGTSLPSLPPNITKKESHFSQVIARNPESIRRRILEEQAVRG